MKVEEGKNQRYENVNIIFFKNMEHFQQYAFCQTPDLGQGLEFDFTFAM